MFVAARKLTQSLMLALLLATPAVAEQRVWNGSADSNVSNPANWDGGVEPQEGDDLYFPDVPNKLVLFDDARTAFYYRSANFDVAGYVLDAPVPNRIVRFVDFCAAGTSAIVSAGITGTITFGSNLFVLASCNRVISSDGAEIVFQTYLSTLDSLRFYSGFLFPSSRVSRFVMNGPISGYDTGIIADWNSYVVVNGNTDSRMSFTATSGGVVEFNGLSDDGTNLSGGKVLGHGTLRYDSTLTSDDFTPGHDIYGPDLTLTVGTSAYPWGTANLTGQFHVYAWGPGDAEHGLLEVYGAVNLGANATPVMHLNYLPAIGDQLLIIRNGGGAVSGTFQGLPEGGTFVSDGVTFQVSYAGGDGNDVVLTVTDMVPAVVGFAAATASVTEGGIATLTVQRTGTTAGTITVDYATASGSAASNTDFTAQSGTLTLTGGTPVTIDIATGGDSLHEAAETFTVQLTNPSGGAVLGTATATVTITDNDPPPQLSIGNVSLSEGNSAGSAVFTVTLDNASGLDASATYVTADGSATAGSDYQARSGTVAVPAGSLSAQIIVPVMGEGTPEGDETFTVTLSSPVNATIGNAQGTATLVNDDADFSFTITPPSQTVTAGGDAVFAVDLATVGSVSPFVVGLRCSGLPTGAACAAPPLTFSGGSASGTLTIHTTNQIARAGWANWAFALFLVAALPVAAPRRRLLLALALLGALSLSLAACGGGTMSRARAAGTPSGTYSITVTADAGNVTHTANVTLQVQ